MGMVVALVAYIVEFFLLFLILFIYSSTCPKLATNSCHAHVTGTLNSNFAILKPEIDFNYSKSQEKSTNKQTKEKHKQTYEPQSIV